LSVALGGALIRLSFGEGRQKVDVGDAEDAVLAALTAIVEVWVGSGEHAVVSAGAEGPSPASMRIAGQAGGGGDAPACHVPSETVAALVRMGYLDVRDAAGERLLIPTTEALCLTDPFLCEELARSLNASFHQTYLEWRAEAMGTWPAR
jgi:hypothetical protein